MTVLRNGERVFRGAMSYAGQPRRFAGQVFIEDSGINDVTVFAYEPRTCDTGLDPPVEWT